jgi:arylsulfatase
VEGALLAQGSFLGGWCFYVQEGRLMYVHNLGGRDVQHISSEVAVPQGRHDLSFNYRRTDEHQGLGTLLIDGDVVGRGEIERFTPVRFSITGAGLTCGYCREPPVSDRIRAPFRFTGTLIRVVVTVEGSPYIDPMGEVEVAFSTQ